MLSHGMEAGYVGRLCILSLVGESEMPFISAPLASKPRMWHRTSMQLHGLVHPLSQGKQQMFTVNIVKCKWVK